MNLISTNIFPIKTSLKKGEGYNSTFSIYPLNPGFGHTIGNALRRAMISSIPGYAVTKIKINNFTHEYQAVEGIVEDLQQIILNIKNLHVKVETGEDQLNLILKKTTKGIVTAGDFGKQAGVTIIDKDLFICTIEKDFELEIIVEIKKGYGFYQIDDAVLSGSQSLSDLYVDALFSPVQNVSIDVEKIRIGDNTNLDKVIITFETNGTVEAKDVINYALKLMVDQYSKIESSFESVNENEEETDNFSDHNADASHGESIESLGLTKVTANALINLNIITTADLGKQKDNIMLMIKTLKSKADKDILLKLLGEKKEKKSKIE